MMPGYRCSGGDTTLVSSKLNERNQQTPFKELKKRKVKNIKKREFEIQI